MLSAWQISTGVHFKGHSLASSALTTVTRYDYLDPRLAAALHDSRYHSPPEKSLPKVSIEISEGVNTDRVIHSAYGEGRLQKR